MMNRITIRSSANLARLSILGLIAAFFPCILPAGAEEKFDPTQRTAIASPGLPVKKSILLLFPYQVDLASSDLATTALREELRAAIDLDCELFYEFFDINRFPEASQLRSHFDLLAARYRDRPIDLVIVQSPRILELWLENRASILPFAPVVFYDTTAENLAKARYPPDVRGVNGVYDFSRSVEWLLSVKPSISEIVLIHGMGVADQRTFSFVETLRRDMKGRVLITDISSLPMAEIKKRIAALPKTSAILYFLMFEDASGVKYRPSDALKELSSVSAVPILSGFEQFIGDGTIGGYMYSIAQQARGAARIGLRILRGEKPESIPIVTEEGNRFIFDHRALLRFNLPLSILPPDSVIKNRRFSVWELYKLQLIAVALAFALLVSLVGLLIAATGRLRSARGALQGINSELESKVLERTTALENSLEENKKLLGELQHRAKNSFGMISALIGLASSQDASDETRNTLAELDQRVMSVSELYSLLYASGSIAELPLDEYCAQVISGIAGLSSSARFLTDFETVMVSAKVTAPVGLILTELATNALKYGQPRGRRGSVAVSLKRVAQGIRLEVKDEGPGFPVGFDSSKESGTGLMLVRTLTAQIHGSFVIEGSSTGTRCELLFAEAEASAHIGQ